MPMIKPLLLSLAVVAVLPAFGNAQRTKVQSCIAADSILGPLTPTQAKAPVSAAYVPNIDNTRLVSGANGDVTLSVSVAVRGRTPISFRPPARLRLMVPWFLYLTSHGGADSVSMFVEIDSAARVSIGPPSVPQFAGPDHPSAVPAYAKLTPEQFLGIARARTLTVSWFDKSFTASADHLAAINAVYRVMLCVEVRPAQ